MWLFSLKPRSDALTCSFRGKMVLVFYPPSLHVLGVHLGHLAAGPEPVWG